MNWLLSDQVCFLWEIDWNTFIIMLSRKSCFISLCGRKSTSSNKFIGIHVHEYCLISFSFQSTYHRPWASGGKKMRLRKKGGTKGKGQMARMRESQGKERWIEILCGKDAIGGESLPLRRTRVDVRIKLPLYT